MLEPTVAHCQKVWPPLVWLLCDHHIPKYDAEKCNEQNLTRTTRNTELYACKGPLKET